MTKIKYKDFFLEADQHKIYVQKGQSAPKGKKIQTGPRGGQFFVGTAKEKEEFSKSKATKDTKQSTEAPSKEKQKPVDKRSEQEQFYINYFDNKKLIDNASDIDSRLSKGEKIFKLKRPPSSQEPTHYYISKDGEDYDNVISPSAMRNWAKNKNLKAKSAKNKTAGYDNYELTQSDGEKSRGTDAPSSQLPKKDSGLSAYKEKAKNSINPKIWDISKLNDADIEALSNRDDDELEGIKRFSNDYNMTPQMAADLYDNTEGLKKKKN